MGITLEEAKQLKYGDMIYSNHFQNADGSPVRWRVNGQVKTWKKDPYRIQIPVKHGMYRNGYLCHGTIDNRVYMRSIILDLKDHELIEEKAIEAIEEKNKNN